MNQPVTNWIIFFLVMKESKAIGIEILRNLKSKSTFNLQQKALGKLVFTFHSVCSKWITFMPIYCFFVFLSGLEGLGSPESWTGCFTSREISYSYSCMGQMLFEWNIWKMLRGITSYSNVWIHPFIIN